MDLVLVAPVVDLPTLDAAEAESVLARPDELQPHWLRRSEGFSTAGVAAYLDATTSAPRQTYHARVRAKNAMLTRAFPDLYERVAAVLHAFTRCPVRYDDGVARPGFHIFSGTGISTSGAGMEHFDQQHLAVQWPFPVSPDAGMMSFTLAIRLPANGAGLDYWPITQADVRRLANLGRRITHNSVARGKPFRHHPYAVGQLTVQLRPFLHRIAPVPARVPGDRRVTLQGHAIRDAGGWVLYW